MAKQFGWMNYGAVALVMGFAASASALDIAVDGITQGASVPQSQALCVATADGKSEPVKAPQRPTIRWGQLPEGTASVAVFMMDPDVPASFTDAGVVGKVIAENAPRQDFFHYGNVEINPRASALPGGNSTQKAPEGRELINNLGAKGYVTPPYAYGGPCPPWNDARLHHYHFIVLALDKDAPIRVVEPVVAASNLNSPRTAANTYKRLIASKSVLDKGEVVGTYTLNASLKP